MRSFANVAEDVEHVTLDWERRWWPAAPAEMTRQPAMPEWMRRVEGYAFHQPLPQLRPQQLMRAIAVAKPRAGVGFDGWIPAMWRQTSDEAVVALTGLLRSVESKLRWPSSQLCSLMRMLSKPSGGHRLIVLTGGLYRVWSQVRRPLLVDWVRQQALIAHWDCAVQGSSALRVALLRACRSEAYKLTGASAVDILWDITKFYDSVLPEVLAEKAVVVDYPMVPLYLGLFVHLSALYVASRGVFGEAAFYFEWHPSRLWAEPGLGQGVSFRHFPDGRGAVGSGPLSNMG